MTQETPKKAPLREIDAQFLASLNELEEANYLNIREISLKIQGLLKKGANASLKSQKGNTLLHLTAGKQSIRVFNHTIRISFISNPETMKALILDTAKVLSLCQPNPFVTNNAGETPYMVATRRMIEALACKSADEYQGYLAASQLLFAYENKFQASANWMAIDALGNLTSGQRYNVEEVIHQDGESVIIERYHLANHQPRCITRARIKAYKIAAAIHGERNLPQ